MPFTLTSPPNAYCWTGIKHTGTPEGRIEPLGGLDTYVSEPPANAQSGPHEKVLLFLADAYGPLLINNKLLQDYFASRGISFAMVCVLQVVADANGKPRIHRTRTGLFLWSPRTESAAGS